ncbi:MAG TPA: hypothetical protein VHQ47_18750 [Phycisphaerae bacterium]|nr:hypothetical protein [Phycisphaerae bacterium]
MHRRILDAAAVILLATSAVAQTRPGVASQRPGTATRPAEAPLVLPENARYTPLPFAVNGAIADPQGRMWFGRESVPYQIQSLEAAKASLAREYHQPAPALDWLAPVLFEPGGRVWCVYNGRQADGETASILIGYDGSSFVEHPAPKGERFAVRFDPLRIGGYTALYVDGTAYFATDKSVLVHNEKGWSSRVLYDDPIDRRPDAVRLFPESSGKGVMVVLRSGGLWRCEAGAWTEAGYGGQISSDSGGEGALLSVMTTSTGVLALTGATLTFTPWETARRPQTAADLVAALDSDDFSVREQATKELIDRGPAVLPDVAHALTAHQNSELRYRLQYILDHLRRRPAGNAGIPGERAVKVGAFEVREPIFLTTLPDGRGIIGALVIDNALGQPATRRAMSAREKQEYSVSPNRAAGVLLVSADGSAKLVGGEDLLAAIVGPEVRYAGFAPRLQPLWTVGSGLAWAAPGSDGASPTLINVEEGKIMETVSSPLAMVPMAATRDMLIMPRPFASPVALRPEAPDPAKAPAPTFVAPLERSSPETVCQTGDGAVWYAGVQTLGRYDGTGAGAPAPGANLTQIDMLSPGQDAVVVESRHQWFLVTRKETFHAAVLEDLIAQEHEVMARSFAGSRPAYEKCAVCIQADAAGNIWLAQKSTEQLKVFASDGWHDATDDLMRAGSAMGRVSAVWPIGDGRQMFVTALGEPGASATARAFVAAFTDGKFSVAAAPELGGIPSEGPLAFSDSAGALWVTARSDRLDGAVMRFTSKGPDRALAGNLRGIDAQDFAWIYRAIDVRTGGNEATPLFAWKKGQTITMPTIPFLASSGRIFAAADGRVFVETDIGLAELRPQGTGNGLRYALTGWVRIATPRAFVGMSKPLNMLYSIERGMGPQGYLRFFKPS